MAKVITFAANGRERTVFDGIEEDAQEYLERNFPRPHIEPGTDYGEEGPPVDAVLIHDNGDRFAFDGKAWAEWTPPSHAPTQGSDAKDREIARLTAELEAAKNFVPITPAANEAAAASAARIAELEAKVQQQRDAARIAELEAQLASQDSGTGTGSEPSTEQPAGVEPATDPTEPAAE